MYSLDESGIQAASDNTFVVSYASGTPSYVLHAAATFSGVHQTATIEDTAKEQSSAGFNPDVDPIEVTVNVVSDGMAVSGAVCGNTGSFTWGNGWTEGTDQISGNTVTMSSAHHAATADGTDTASADHSSTINRQVIVAASLAPAVGGNSPPTLTVDQPDGTDDTITVGDNYNIQYDLSDSDDVVTVAFYYDNNASGLDGTTISGACASGAEGTNVTCTWDTTGMTPGSYYVYGITDDGTNPQVSDYSSGQITINATPGIKNIYYSVGTATSDLKTGSATMDISGGTATLNIAQTGDIGLGDVITYNTSSKAYISAITNTTTFTVQTATGEVPANVTDATVDSIKRVFNSIADAESQSSGVSYLNTSNLVTGGYTLTLVCYNDGPFSEAVTIDGYTTDADNYVTLTVAGASQIASGSSQRHTGTAGTGAVVQPPAAAGYGISIEDAYTVVEWLEVDGSNVTTLSSDGVQVEVAGTNNVTIQYLIIHDWDETNDGGIYADQDYLTVRNTIIYGNYCSVQLGTGGDYGTFQNVTIHGGPNCGFMVYGSTGWIVENVISMGATGDDFSDDGSIATCNNNMSEDSTADDCGGSGHLINQTIADQFVSISGSIDLHLKSGADAIDSGTNLWSDFTFDIDRDTRPETGTWDIGADEFQEVNLAPTQPTTPYSNNNNAQSGQTNPNNITDPSPAFSAVYADPNTSDVADKYRVEVNTASDFTGTVMWDSGAAGTSMTNTNQGSRCPDIIYAGDPLSDSTTYYWRIRFWDDDGLEGTASAAQSFSTSALGLKTIYYSVGTAGDKKDGSPSIDISSGVATLTVAQNANAVGVGDVIDYDSDNKKAYIKQVNSATGFLVQTATGFTPSDITGATVNSIERAFTNLSTAESSSGNSDHLNTTDLLSGDYTLTWICYNDAAFSQGRLVIQGWTTDSTRTLTLTAADSSQVANGQSQRHTGTAGSGARLVLANDTGEGVIWVRVHDTTVEWMEFDANGMDVDTIFCARNNNANRATLRNCILHGMNPASVNDAPNGPAAVYNDYNQDFKCYNNITRFSEKLKL
jgi:hypothetical protein